MQIKEIEQKLIEQTSCQKDNDYKQGYIDGIKIMSIKVNNVYEFYKKYKGNQFKLAKYEPEIYKIWNKFSLYQEENYAELCSKDEAFEITTFTNWFLNYCFGDVIE